MDDGSQQNSENEQTHQIVSKIADDPEAVQELAHTLFPPLLASLEQLADKNRERQGESHRGKPENRDGVRAAAISSNTQHSPAKNNGGVNPGNQLPNIYNYQWAGFPNAPTQRVITRVMQPTPLLAMQPIQTVAAMQACLTRAMQPSRTMVAMQAYLTRATQPTQTRAMQFQAMPT